MSPQLSREQLAALFSGVKNNDPVVEDVDMEGPRATEYKAPCIKHDLKCGECGAPMVLRKSTKYDSPFYGCSTFPECRGTVGAHRDGRPKGTPGDRKTKDARIKAHKVFDRIWEDGRMTQNQAYAWLCKVMQVSGKAGHIGHFTVAQCEQLIAAVRQSFPEKLTLWEKLRDHARRFTED